MQRWGGKKKKKKKKVDLLLITPAKCSKTVRQSAPVDILASSTEQLGVGWSRVRVLEPPPPPPKSPNHSHWCSPKQTEVLFPTGRVFACGMMLLVGGFFRGYPVSPPLHFSLIIISSQDLDAHLSLRWLYFIHINIHKSSCFLYASAGFLGDLPSPSPRPRIPTLLRTPLAVKSRSNLPTPFSSHFGATIAERLACSPPTTAIRAQSPAGLLRNHAGRCRWSAGFLGDLPFPQPFHSCAATYSPRSPSSALKTSIGLFVTPTAATRAECQTTNRSRRKVAVASATYQQNVPQCCIRCSRLIEHFDVNLLGKTSPCAVHVFGPYFIWHALGNSEPINESFTVACSNHARFSCKERGFSSMKQPAGKTTPFSVYAVLTFDWVNISSGCPLVDDRPRNVVKYRLVSGVAWTNRTMVSSNTGTNRTGVLAVVDIVLYALEPASFLHWLLHMCEGTPSLTVLHVIGAHNCEVLLYWCRVTKGVSHGVWYNDKRIAKISTCRGCRVGFVGGIATPALLLRISKKPARESETGLRNFCNDGGPTTPRILQLRLFFYTTVFQGARQGTHVRNATWRPVGTLAPGSES
ncbi:hypothetical protein PR048_032238 [Dryococelus australis]|uniref:Uncharacterized protein n=1 Tax=Dryococelus australis TaxID=614101 RepID=A0ABQ9G1N6_9NEOP|nr:hypothetical protein PR048_032238 [Dryococelus australis]